MTRGVAGTGLMIRPKGVKGRGYNWGAGFAGFPFNLQRIKMHPIFSLKANKLPIFVLFGFSALTPVTKNYFFGEGATLGLELRGGGVAGARLEGVQI